ncbi:MAG: diguanylate cyclase, partial [Cyanobacteriota bacterium]
MPDLSNYQETEFKIKHWLDQPIPERQYWQEAKEQYATPCSYLETKKPLQQSADVDSLIQTANRRRFQAYLEPAWQQMAQEQASLSLILGDLDFFKAYNNTYGYQAGDQCLQRVAQIIANALDRHSELVPHYGGEEFAVILPKTSAQEAVRVAENIRLAVKSLKISLTHFRPNQHLTLSLGIAALDPTPEYPSAMLLNAAEQSLEQAKAQGRDRVILHETLLRQKTVKVMEKTPSLLQK